MVLIWGEGGSGQERSLEEVTFRLITEAQVVCGPPKERGHSLC